MTCLSQASLFVRLCHLPSPSDPGGLLRADFALANHPQCPQHHIKKVCPTVLLQCCCPSAPCLHDNEVVITYSLR